MDFNSQICTTREQSERLLSLGLKQETADMTHHYLHSIDGYELKDVEFSRIMHLQELVNKKPVMGMSGDALYAKDLPAWSLHRLMSLMPRTVNVDGRVYGCMMELGGCVQYINLLVDKIIWSAHYSVSNSFDGLINCIEWLIKEEHFNKAYLEE